MFKFLWKFLKKIRAEGDNAFAYVAELADPRNKAKCAKIIELCCAESGDPFAGQYPALVQACLRQAITLNPPSLQDLLDAACTVFAGEKQLQAKVTVVNGYFGGKRSKYILLLRMWHFHLAIADILLGRYEDLDPIIGDQACEMRCPFLLDVASVVLEAAGSFQGRKGAGINYLITLAKAVYQLARKYPNDNVDGLESRVIDALLAQHPEDFIAFCDLCAERLNGMPGPTGVEFLGHPVTFEDVKYIVNDAPKLVDLEAPLCITDKKIDWGKEQDRPPVVYSAAEYLRLCKSFTRNREALIDDFGIDIDHESTLKYYDVAQKQRRYKVKDLNREISDYEKQLLAHCSTAYMKFAARDIDLRIGAPNMLSSVYTIVDKCQATINGSGFMMNLVPVFDAFRVILAHAAKKGHPIVVNLTRLIVLDGDAPKFQHQANWVLYYEPDRDGRFILVEDLEERHLKRPAIAVVAASVVNPGKLCNTGLVEGSAFINALDPDEFLAGFKTCDIAHLLMWFAANHPTFPGSVCLPICSVPEPQILVSDGKKPAKETPPTIKWVQTQDCGRSYARRGLYVNLLGAPEQDHPSGAYTFSLITAPCSMLKLDGDHHTLAWEYDYYLHLTRALGLEIEAVKYALMSGARGEDGDTVWHRNLATLPFTPTHMYVTTAETEIAHQNKLPYEEGESVDISIRKSTMSRKSQIFDVDYNINDSIDAEDDDEKKDNID